MNGIIDNGTIEPAVLVLGAGGAVGRGVVAAAIDAGRRVVAVACDAGADDALHALRQEQPPGAALTVLHAAIASDADAADLARRLVALGVPFDGVVASIAGEHACGSLIDQPADVLRRTLDEDLMPHLFAARHLFPLLPHDGHHGYVLVGGPGANYPWAGYGHCSIAAAALRMMARVLHDEAARHGLRVQLLSLDAPVGTDANAAAAGAGWPKAEAIGRRALALLEARRDTVAPAVVDLSPSRKPSRAPPRPAATTVEPAGPARPARPGTDLVPARELRDARALLASLSVLPPSPGILHDETS